jgi:hypothetical protein
MQDTKLLSALKLLIFFVCIYIFKINKKIIIKKKLIKLTLTKKFSLICVRAIYN